MKSIANVDQIETYLNHRDNGKFNFLLFSNRIEFTANKPPNYSLLQQILQSALVY